jgi:thiol-disulfide isomerase/thioredoxin
MRAVIAAALLVTASAASAKEPAFAALQGDITVVAFFASTCKPCKRELPFVEALHKSLAADKRVRVVAASVDDRDAEPARAWVRELHLTMPVIVEPQLYMALFAGSGEANEASVPRLAVIDRRRHGLERSGALAGETAESFAREVTAAIESVRAGKAEPPTPMWQPLRAAR